MEATTVVSGRQVFGPAVLILLCKPRASGGTAYGVDTRQTRFPAPSMRECGARHLQRINCPRLPGDRELRQKCAGSYFTIKETSHAIRHSDRLDSSRGRRVRAADGAGVERQGAGKHVSLRLETKERDRSHLYVTYATKRRVAAVSSSNSDRPAVRGPTRRRKRPSISEAARVGRFTNNRKGTMK